MALHTLHLVICLSLVMFHFLCGVLFSFIDMYVRGYCPLRTRCPAYVEKCTTSMHIRHLAEWLHMTVKCCKVYTKPKSKGIIQNLVCTCTCRDLERTPNTAAGWKRDASNFRENKRRRQISCMVNRYFHIDSSFLFLHIKSF